ncbi:MAG: S-layer homology domain-containing protein [Clostridia bacterium]|nr:S-layer homology domain-containing protein [Clostridia bacterium]
MKNRALKYITLILSVLITVSAIPFSVMAADGPFTDVPSDAYYPDAVMWAYENGITTGTTETKFAPASTCTRAQVVTFLWRALGQPMPEGKNTFSDILPGNYYYNAVLWACENGITNGTSKTEFSPARTCSVAHIVTFIYRAFGEPDRTGEGEWYADAIRWAKDSGLIEGTESDKAGAGIQELNSIDCPRADVVTVLYRYKGTGTLTIHVAPEGNDETGDGSLENPFATITAARDAIRNLDKSGYNGITVFIEKGEYQLTEPIVFTDEDSGTETCTIKYIGEKGVSIVGGVKFRASDFTKAEGGLTEYFTDDVRDKMVMIDLNQFGITPDMVNSAMTSNKYNTALPFLSLNGERQMLAQYPNDFLHVGKTVTHSEDGTTNTAIDYVTLQTVDYGQEHAAFVQSWSQILPVFVRARLYKLWCPDDTRVAEIYKDEPKVDIYFAGGHEPEEGTILYFYNVPEAIDAPGEYIVDRNAVLYYYPTEEFETGLFTMPVVSQFVTAKGTDYITIQNIEFTSCNGEGMNLSGRHLSLIGNTISGVKGRGLRMSGDGLMVQDNVLFNLGDQAMYVQSGDPATGEGDRTYVCENDAHDYSLTASYGNALTATGANITVSHNDFHDANSCGIYVPSSVNVLVEYNELWNLSHLCEDMGMLSAGGYDNANIVFRYNYVHDIYPGGEAGKILDHNPDYGYYGTFAIYYDNGTSYIETYGNIVSGVDTGFLSNGGRGNKTHNNLFMNCRMWYIWYSHFMYRPADDGTISDSVNLPNYVYNDFWVQLNPELSRLVLRGEETDATDPLLWCAPAGNECRDNYILFNKADRLITNWGIRPENIETYVQQFCGNDVSVDYSQMETYTSRRNDISPEEAIEMASGVVDMDVQTFITIGRVTK